MTNPSQSHSIEDLDPPEESTGELDSLIVLATRDLYRGNAFRITGLDVDAPIREVNRRTEKLRLMAELGGPQLDQAGFGLQSAPCSDEIRSAIQRLREPTARFLDEFFWFWPECFGDSESDSALAAIKAGNGAEARRIWLEREQAANLIAAHNLAVLFHLEAIEQAEVTSETTADFLTPWTQAIQRWDWLGENDDFWFLLARRVCDIDDPQVTGFFLTRLRLTLPLAIDKISAIEALGWAEKGNLDLAMMHGQLIRGHHTTLDGVERVFEIVLKPLSRRIQGHIEHTVTAYTSDPMRGKSAADGLIDSVGPVLESIDILVGGDHEFPKEQTDRVVACGTEAAIVYQRASGDSVGFLEVLSRLEKFRCSEEAARRISESKLTAIQYIEDEKLPRSLVDRLEELRQSCDPAAERFAAFQSGCMKSIVLLGEVGAVNAQAAVTGLCIEVLESIAHSARDDAKDPKLASEILTFALYHVRDDDTRLRMEEEVRQLAALKPVQPGLGARFKALIGRNRN